MVSHSIVQRDAGSGVHEEGAGVDSGYGVGHTGAGAEESTNKVADGHSAGYIGDAAVGADDTLAMLLGRSKLAYAPFPGPHVAALTTNPFGKL